MAWKSSPKKIKFLILTLFIVFILAGLGIFWMYKNQEANLAKAQTITHDVLVKATVLPTNPTLGYTTIFIGTGNTPTVTVNDITVNNNPTNLPVTCTINYQTPGGQNVIVTTTTQSVNECNYSPAIPPDLQNATVTDGNPADITDASGVGTIEISVSLANSTIKSPPFNYKVGSDIDGPSLNVQNLQPAIDLNNRLDVPSDLITKINFYSGVIIATSVAVTGYLLIFFNIVNSFKVTKFRDFTEELMVSLDIQPKEIYTGDPIRFVSKIYDETDKPVNNLECVLTIVTPAKIKIKIKVLTNKDGKCGVYISKDGVLDNQAALKEENLHPAEIERGSLKDFNSVAGHGIAYTKAKVYSSRYHSRQSTWTVREKN